MNKYMYVTLFMWEREEKFFCLSYEANKSVLIWFDLLWKLMYYYVSEFHGMQAPYKAKYMEVIW